MVWVEDERAERAEIAMSGQSGEPEDGFSRQVDTMDALGVPVLERIKS